MLVLLDIPRKFKAYEHAGESIYPLHLRRDRESTFLCGLDYQQICRRTPAEQVQCKPYGARAPLHQNLLCRRCLVALLDLFCRQAESDSVGGQSTPVDNLRN